MPDSKLHWYTLDPIDLLLMREAKPFSPGDGSWAKGQFPPLPITVFQAMRSATRWIGDESDRDQKRDLHFKGPFLLHSPPGEEATLWLPTPQDLICVKSAQVADPQNADYEPDQDEEDFTETATQWERTARFQPLDKTNPAWQHLGFDPEYFSGEPLTPMVPPMRPSPDKAPEPLLTKKHNTYLRRLDTDAWERIAGRPDPWIRADSLLHYLHGEVLENPATLENEQDAASKAIGYFHKDPWTTQVLPHIQVLPGTRQVKDEEGYFTEVAIRMAPHWQLVAGISTKLEAKVVRLGGEGHRAIVTPMDGAPPGWEALEKLRSPNPSNEKKSDRTTAYVLTPGLAEATIDSELFSLIPETWKPLLRSCVGDRPLLWGGMSVFQKKGESQKDVAFQPQRAFVPPGTIYRFQAGQIPAEFQIPELLLPRLPSQADNTSNNWLTTFRQLNYGILLWGQ